MLYAPAFVFTPDKGQAQRVVVDEASFGVDRYGIPVVGLHLRHISNVTSAGWTYIPPKDLQLLVDRAQAMPATVGNEPGFLEYVGIA